MRRFMVLVPLSIGTNVALAGVGIKGGQVIGATSPDGARVIDRPVTIHNLLQLLPSLADQPAKNQQGARQTSRSSWSRTAKP
jgi:hypothetical protein